MKAAAPDPPAEPNQTTTGLTWGPEEEELQICRHHCIGQAASRLERLADAGKPMA
jgi:hypothetical protein